MPVVSLGVATRKVMNSKSMHWIERSLQEGCFVTDCSVWMGGLTLLSVFFNYICCFVLFYPALQNTAL